MSGAQQVTFMNQRSFGPLPASQTFASAGTFSWVVPALVTKVSVVAVGGGAGGGVGDGGGLGYKNNIAVTPGTSITVVVGAGSQCAAGGQSYFCNVSLVRALGGGQGTPAFTGDGGGNGGAACGNGGGGAGGYSGNGGSSPSNGNGTAGSGGGGGGGGSVVNIWNGGIPCCGFCQYHGGGGGGVGLLGQGSSGSGGTGGVGFNGSLPIAGGGGGGSGGGSGTNGTFPGAGGGLGGSYGGGGTVTQEFSNCGYYQANFAGAGGAVRIVWPGCARSFPSTNVGVP